MKRRKYIEIENMKAWRNKINGALIVINVLLLGINKI
jgi:hypothetical protein